MQGILHITALQPCEFLPLLKTFFHSDYKMLIKYYKIQILKKKNSIETINYNIKSVSFVSFIEFFFLMRG